MKPYLLDRKSQKDASFTISHNTYPHFLKIWHYHSQVELVLVVKSTGTRFIGDSIQKFESGELVLLGSNLPHMWLNDEVYFNSDESLLAEAIAIHFDHDFLGREFFKTNEFASIGELLHLARRGIKFNSIPETIIEQFQQMEHLDPFPRSMKLINLLKFLSQHNDFEVLSSLGYIDSFQEQKNERLQKVYAYIFDNFQHDINCAKVAAHVGMNPSAFSRYFKKTHRKTFSSYLNEIKIGYACKLLLERESTITEIAYEAGFNNISNFNRQFRAIKKVSPKEYIKSFKNL